MKARSFLTGIAGVLLALLLLAFTLLWGIDRRSPLRLASQPLELPRAARFVPKEADLALHWLSDPVRLPAYVQAVSQPSERRASGMLQGVGAMGYLLWQGLISTGSWRDGWGRN